MRLAGMWFGGDSASHLTPADQAEAQERITKLAASEPEPPLRKQLKLLHSAVANPKRPSYRIRQTCPWVLPEPDDKIPPHSVPPPRPLGPLTSSNSLLPIVHDLHPTPPRAAPNSFPSSIHSVHSAIAPRPRCARPTCPRSLHLFQ
jgi:hypothetical protein